MASRAGISAASSLLHLTWGSAAQDCPCLTLEVRPYAVLRNSMRYAVVLEAGTMRTLAPPGAAVPFCWPPQQQRPRTAFVTVRSRTTEGVYVALRSAAFSLEPGTAVPLDCSQTAAGQPCVDVPTIFC